MIKIISDTATLYSPAEASSIGFDAAPFHVTIQGTNYEDYQDIKPEDCAERLRQGHKASISQPDLTTLSSLYKKYPEDDIINITPANGLSATYHSACMAAGLDKHPDRITVVNSRTLCGPQRYMVEKAVDMAQAGCTKKEILEEIELLISDNESYLLPGDFNYLIKSGRLSLLSGQFNRLMKNVPVITQSSNRRTLEKCDIKRNLSEAVESIGKSLLSKNINDSHKIYVGHACAESLADRAIEKLKNMGLRADFELHMLSPSLVAEGGLGSMSIQYVRK